MADYKLSYTAEEIERLLGKVDNGEVMVDVGDYGIDIISLIGAGGGTATVTGTAEMWEQINAHRDCTLTSIAYDGARAYMRPNYISEYKGLINYVAAQVFIDMGSGTIVTANILLYAYRDGHGGYEGTTVVTVVVAMSQIPG